MNFEDTLKNLRDLMQKDAAKKAFHTGFISYSEKTIRKIEEDILCATDDGTPEIGESDIDDVLAVLHDSINFMVNKSLSDEATSFIYGYASLAMNWNQLANSDKITEAIRTLGTLHDMKNSFIALIETSRRLSSRMEELEKRRPPYYELSEHYLRAIKKSLD